MLGNNQGCKEDERYGSGNHLPSNILPDPSKIKVIDPPVGSVEPGVQDGTVAPFDFAYPFQGHGQNILFTEQFEPDRTL